MLCIINARITNPLYLALFLYTLSKRPQRVLSSLMLGCAKNGLLTQQSPNVEDDL